MFCVFMLQGATITGDATCTSYSACYVSERIHADHTVVLLVTSINCIRPNVSYRPLSLVHFLTLTGACVLCYVTVRYHNRGCDLY